MKKIMISLCLILAVQSSFVFAEGKIPSDFWKLIEKEATLASTDDLRGQIENWKKIISLFDDWDDDNQKKLEIVTPRIQKIIKNYEALKDYDNALVYLKLYAENASRLENLGLWNEDARIWAESKIINLDLNIELFVNAKIEEYKKTLAKYEPAKGLIYGATYDLDPSIDRLIDVGNVEAYPKENSAFLIYLEFGQSANTFDWYISQAKEAKRGILLAWNSYEVYDDMAKHTAYINETANYLKKLDIPVFLRYGAEFNIAEAFEDHKGYIENYKYVADIMREKAPNVAMVWSPNEISAAGRNHEDYYPGDEYVDWVGISTYSSYYFGSKKDYGDKQAAIDNQYFTGTKANPLNKIKDIVSTYGHKKPIMITENGIGHYSKVAKEDLTDWAKVQLQRTYAYIPLKYPEVKAIFYFNAHVKSNTRNIYALYENEVIQKEFVKLTSTNLYLDDMDKKLSHYPYSANEKTVFVLDKTIDFQTLAVIPEVLNASVKYTVNDTISFESKELPYKWSLDIDKLKDGKNTLKLDVFDDKNTLIKSLDYVIVKNSFYVYVSTLEDYNKK